MCLITKNQKYANRGLPNTAAKTIVDSVVSNRVCFHTEGFFDCRECPIDMFNERYVLVEDNPESTKEKELLDCIENLMGVFDTPITRAKIKGTFANEVREMGRELLYKYGRTNH